MKYLHALDDKTPTGRQNDHSFPTTGHTSKKFSTQHAICRYFDTNALIVDLVDPLFLTAFRHERALMKTLSSGRLTTIHGFTLIEVMIVVAIIAILSAVALPSYNEYVTRGRIPDATSGLAERRVRLEQFFQDNRTYAGSPDCPDAADTAGRFFNFSCVAPANAANYTLQAVGKGPMAGFTFTINQAGTRTSAVIGAPAAQGWAGNGACWISRKGGQC